MRLCLRITLLIALYVSVSTPAPLYASDVAVLESQGDYVTVAPGTSVDIWINVRNAGTTTWNPESGYGWEGVGVWANGVGSYGSRGALWRSVPPGGILSFSESIVAPQAPGPYEYGFYLTRNGSRFGPRFFIRVIVFAEVTVYPSNPTPWSLTCEPPAPTACLPAVVTISSSLPNRWKDATQTAIGILTSADTRLRLSVGTLPNSSRYLKPKWFQQDNGTYPDLGNIRLAPGEIRIIADTFLPSNVRNLAKGAYGIPYIDPRNPSRVIAGLVIIPQEVEIFRLVDLATLIAHEIGHTIGLRHVENDSNAVMYPADNFFDGFVLPRKRLAPGDIQQLQQLYGSGGSGVKISRPELSTPTRFGPTDPAATFSWKPTSGASRYYFELSDSAGFHNLLYQTTTTATSVTVPVPLGSQSALADYVPEQAYYWRVKATQDGINSDWSFPWKVRFGTRSCTLRADANCDGKVSLVDLEIWRQEYLGEAQTRYADFNGDGRVSLIDIQIWCSIYIDGQGLQQLSVSRSAVTNIEPFGERGYSVDVTAQPIPVILRTADETDTITLQRGESFTFDVIVVLDELSDAIVSGSAITLQYDPTLLRYTPPEELPPTFTACSTDSGLPEEYGVWVDEVFGRITLSRGTSTTQTVSNTKFCLGTVVFSTQLNTPSDSITSVQVVTDERMQDIVGPQTDFVPIEGSGSRLNIVIDPVSISQVGIYLPLIIR